MRPVLKVMNVIIWPSQHTSSISKLETALRIHNAKNIISLIYNIYKKSIIILIMYKNREYYAIHILYIHMIFFLNGKISMITK